MKSQINRIAIALVIVSLMGITALAKTRKATITLDSSMKVNGTVLKKGNYDLRFDEEKNELSILKAGKVVARSTINTQKRDRKAERLELKSTGTGDEKELISVAFGGADFNVVLNGQATR